MFYFVCIACRKNHKARSADVVTVQQIRLLHCCLLLIHLISSNALDVFVASLCWHFYHYIFGVIFDVRSLHVSRAVKGLHVSRALERDEKKEKIHTQRSFGVFCSANDIHWNVRAWNTMLCYKDALSERNLCAGELAKLYFVIAKK